jgi:enamine deaminase RidA (YjgF/YER057c/UK114 family)
MDREVIVPQAMERIFQNIGYAPAVRVGPVLFVSGQVGGMTREIEPIHEPEAQFLAAFDNLREVLETAGCSFADIVDLTTFHVDLETHREAFIAVKNRVFPRQSYAWTMIGVAALGRPWMLLELKAIALVPGK